MKRTLIAVAALVGLASAANAATLSISGGGTYTVGDTITLTITGDSAGASALNATGILNFSNPSIGNLGAAVGTQNTLLAFGSIPWTVGAFFCGLAGPGGIERCKPFDQLSAFGLSPAPASNLLVATVQFVATTPGISSVVWETDSNTGFQLQFFGLSNAPGTSITVVPIPEPTTAALLGLGLFGLALAGRRR